MDQRVLITGATSGIGRAAAARCAALGATVHLLGHNTARATEALQWLAAQVPAGRFELELCDLQSLADVRRFADDFATQHDSLDALAHNAGVYSEHRQETPEGHERTYGVHVLAPHLLNHALAPLLSRAPAPRVVVMSSGGMYAQRLTDDVEFRDDSYSGTAAYARTKRMQVVLAHMWAYRLADAGVAVHAMHPGWVDTPGVRTYLSTFRALTRPVIRTRGAGRRHLGVVAGHETDDTVVRGVLARPGASPSPPLAADGGDAGRPRPLHGPVRRRRRELARAGLRLPAVAVEEAVVEAGVEGRDLGPLRAARLDGEPAQTGAINGLGERLFEGVRVEPALLADVADDGSLVAVVAAAGGNHRGAEVATRLEPAGVSAEAVGQHGDVERGQVGEELGIGHEVVDPQVDETRRLRVPQWPREIGAVAGAAGLEEVTVTVDLHHRAGVRADERAGASAAVAPDPCWP